MGHILCLSHNVRTRTFGFLIVLRFNDTPTLLGHFVSSPREREKIDRIDSRRDEREGQGRKTNRNESEETKEIKTFPLDPYLLQGQQALPNCKPVSAGHPGDVRYIPPSHHPTTPTYLWTCAQRRFGSTCAFAQSHQNLHWVPFGQTGMQGLVKWTKKTLSRLRGCTG